MTRKKEDRVILVEKLNALADSWEDDRTAVIEIDPRSVEVGLSKERRHEIVEWLINKGRKR